MTEFTFPTTYQEYIALSRYARYDHVNGRRERWHETVQRLMTFWKETLPQVPEATLARLQDSITNLRVMPSMRSLMTAGPALARDNVAGYNCSFAAIEGSGPMLSIMTDEMKEAGFEEPITLKMKHPIVFDELFYVLLCGTGAGFSVERQYTNQLPTVGKPLDRSIYKRTHKNFPGVAKQELSYFDKKHNTIHVSDSKYGWASALRILIVELYNGNFDVKWDVSEVRPAGQVLKVFGGRSSGPQALTEMFTKLVHQFKDAAGRKLSSIECHDVVCNIAAAVVVGGVRRAATLSLSNLSDERMRHAKSGDWWVDNSQRALANNSVAYTEKPSTGSFMREWTALYDSKSGERGIFNREAATRQAKELGRDTSYELGGNPCQEISLRSKQFCNLTEVVARPDDTYEVLKDKVEDATILGTMQATLTNFVYLSSEWKRNTEEERLLGVSITGCMDHPVLRDATNEARAWLAGLHDHAWEVNTRWAKVLGIPVSKAITCNKPSGTVSQLTDAASGIHPRYSPYYIRRVRNDAKDPLATAMVESGYPYEVDVMNPSTLVFGFPMKAPETAVFRDDRSAIQQLEYWLMWKQFWADHSVSVTVYVKEDEWFEVGAWVYEHFDEITGVSFLPHSDHTYKQAPYEEITEMQYHELLSKMPAGINYELLADLETTDHTTGMREFACTGGACEIV